MLANKQLQFLHWTMAICFVLLFSVGIYMADLPKEVSYKFALYNFHKSMGVLVMGLLVTRIFIALRSASPNFSQKTSTWLRTTVLHTSLYLFMLVVPISGYLFSNFGGKNVAFFGLGLPPIVSESKDLVGLAKNAHFWLAYTFLAFISVHVLVQHKYILGVWRRFSRRLSAQA
jgi:cytochrome b561